VAPVGGVVGVLVVDLAAAVASSVALCDFGPCKAELPAGGGEGGVCGQDGAGCDQVLIIIYILYNIILSLFVELLLLKVITLKHLFF
jgi:hypothetical protein